MTSTIELIPSCIELVLSWYRTDTESVWGIGMEHDILVFENIKKGMVFE